jgi:TonB family protein
MRSKALMSVTNIVLALFCCLLFCLPSAAQSAVGWREYVSKEGKFGVMFPGTPETGYRPVGADSDSSVTYVTNLIVDARAWTVAWFDLPKALTDEGAIKVLFDQTRDKMLKMYSMKMAKEEGLKWLDYPARTFTTKPDDRDRIQVCRIVLVKQRVYEVWVLVESNAVNSQAVTKFFDSFKLVPLTDEELAKAVETSKRDAAKAVPRKIRVSNGVLQENALKKVQPVRPAGIKTKGTVEVNLVVSEQGDVLEAKAVSGNPLLNSVAVEAAKQWKFKPIALSGHPVMLEGVLVIEVK